VRLVNKLSGRTHEVRGDEFEIKLVYERLGYNFGAENPLVLTSSDLQVQGHECRMRPAAAIGSFIICYSCTVRKRRPASKLR